MHNVHQHTHLFMWCCCPPSHLSPTVKRDHRGVWRNTICLTKYPGTGKQFSHHNSRSECAWFSQCVIPYADDLPFSSSSLPFSALLKLPGEEQTQALLSRTRIWTLQNTQGLHRLADSHSLDLQMDFYLFTLPGFFSPFLWTIQRLLESGWSMEGMVIHPLYHHYFC